MKKYSLHIKIINRERCCDNFFGEDITVSLDISCQNRIRKNKENFLFRLHIRILGFSKK